MAACSGPKYTYYFDRYDYNAGKKKAGVAKEMVASQETPRVNPGELTASLTQEPVIVENTGVAKEITVPVKKTYVQMTKTERKALRNYIKSEIKAKVEKKEVVQHAAATQGMDKDLKLAAVFGAVGIVALIIGGDVFWIIGGIAMLIGVIFFVKWLVRQ